MITGLSVIICCYNSEKRIAATLKSLSEQIVENDRYWELILVDNGCTDNTVPVAAEYWLSYGSPAPVTFISEPNPGLSNARRAGIMACKTEFAIFCDDDNWLFRDYINRAINIMKADNLIGACGGQGFPVFESQEPDWFKDYQEAFATGPQHMTSENGCQLSLYGAGLVVRVSLVQKIWQADFELQFEDRVGTNLSSSGDTELTNIICLLGYRNYYGHDLHFFHYMPKDRMTRNYLKRLYRAFGTDGPIRNIYHSFLTNRLLHLICLYWPTHVLLIVGRLVKYCVIPPKRGGRDIYLAWCLAYLKSLFRLRPFHQDIVENVRRIVHSGISVNQHNRSNIINSTQSAAIPHE